MDHPINAILEVVLLLLNNGHPVIVAGGLETRIILRNLQSKWTGSVLKLNFGSEMSMHNCMHQLTQHLSRKGENHLQPSDGRKLLWMVRQLETSRVQREGCMMSMLCDIAKNKTIYSRESGFRRKKLVDVSFIGQIDRIKGAEMLSTFAELNYFNIVSAKGCTPTAIIAPPSNLESGMPQDVFDATLAIYSDLGTAFGQNQLNSNNPGKMLSLHELENSIRCLKSSGVSDEEEARKQWRQMLFQNLYLPLWYVLRILNGQGSDF